MQRIVGTAIGVLLALSPVASAQPAITWDPASSRNYSASSGRTIDMIVIHKAEGSLDSAVSWFQNPGAAASAHYVVNESQIVQCVADKNVAWHAGNHYYNVRSIGIENEGYSTRNDTTDAHYQRLAQLVAYLCGQYGIPIDRQHIIGHSQVPDPNHPGKFGGSGRHVYCPGPNFDWTLFMGYVNQYAGSPSPTPTPTPTPTPPSTGSVQAVTVTASALNVRDSAGGAILGTVPNGSGWVRTGNESQGYIEIYYRGQTAWIYQAYTQGYSGYGAQIDASNLNVRTAGSTSATIVGQVYQGQIYVEGGVMGSWVSIRYDQWRRWVYKPYTSDVAVSP